MKLNKSNVTYLPQKNGIEKKWWLIDASDLVLGRLATRISDILRGKDHANYTPFFDCGDHVIVINARKVRLTGGKEEQKLYYRHSGYRGGIKEISYERMLATHPERIVMNAVKGMLPKNKLSYKLLTKLKVYADGTHGHAAQKPETLKITGGKS
jgi:large subunit ribosomal protein L13